MSAARQRAPSVGVPAGTAASSARQTGTLAASATELPGDNVIYILYISLLVYM